VIWEEQDSPRQYNAKPDAHTDFKKKRLADAVGHCKEKLFADGAATL
jgi:hypothetical protein